MNDAENIEKSLKHLTSRTHEMLAAEQVSTNENGAAAANEECKEGHEE